MNQLAIDFARAAGETAANACTAKAQRSDPEFTAKAKAAILAHLRAVGRARGEDLVEIAKAHGAIPVNGDKAFGSIFLSLIRKDMVVVLRSDLPRKRGHGTTGGKLYGIKWASIT